MSTARALQSPPGEEDSDTATAEGLEVFTGGAPTVAVGDLVTLTGDVQEFAPGDDELPRTQIAAPSTVVACASAPPCTYGGTRGGLSRLIICRIIPPQQARRDVYVTVVQADSSHCLTSTTHAIKTTPH